MRRLRVLISAYACEPGQGSEPGVGWNVSREMAKYHDVWVLTRADNRAEIEFEVGRNPIPNLKFAYYDLPSWANSWAERGQGIQLHYLFWQHGAFAVAQKLHREILFDLSHHVTFVRYWMPSLLARLPVPFIWGPVGGGETAPPAFLEDFGREGRRFERLRDLARWLGEHDPFVRRTARRSRMALATTQETGARMRALGARNVRVMGESGLGSQAVAQIEQLADSTDRVRFVSVGRLVHWKGYHLGLRAFAAAELAGAEYWLVGDGPERQRLEALARSLGIADRVTFKGRQPRQETLRLLAQSSALVHPSLHDSGGWVCLEAMAASRPVICLDLGGPATQVTEEAGFRIAARAPGQAVRDMADAMRRLAEDSELQRRLGSGGRRRVGEELNWENKIRELSQKYYEVTGAAE